PFRKTTVAKTAIFGNLRNTTKLTSNQFSPEVIDDFLHGGVIIKQEPEMNVDLLAGFKDPNGKIYDANALAKMKKDIEDVWDNSLGLQHEFFSLLDVSSNANQLGVSFGTNWQIVKTGTVRG